MEEFVSIRVHSCPFVVLNYPIIFVYFVCFMVKYFVSIRGSYSPSLLSFFVYFVLFVVK